MADTNYSGAEDENAELKKLQAEVFDDSDNFELWEKLVRAAEAQEGGINRNSSPQAITTTRDSYDRFLAKFPLLFGYWKKYADLEFSIGGTEAAEMVYERGIASVTSSVDLWTNYCSFKAETSHEYDVIRELFERGANSVGLDFLAHPFWDKYIEFEERLEATDKIFAVLGRVIHIPMHQYARYFERYRQLAQTRPLPELVPAETLSQFRAEVESAAAGVPPGSRSEAEVERDIRLRIDGYHLEIFTRTQTETTKRWTYESEIKRPYFHVTELDEGQLTNWRKYLDFEEGEGSYARIQFLYERCLVTCAHYDEFWMRYARWMSGQEDKEEEARNIYQRASTLYVPISRPEIRLQYSYFEEVSGRVDIAKDIHSAILFSLPGHVETIISFANQSRRHGGLDAAIDVYKSQLDSPECDIQAKAALVAEWAKLLWKVKGAPDEAREVFQNSQQWYSDSRPFWASYLMFELEQPTSTEVEDKQYERIHRVIDDIRTKSKLEPMAAKGLIQVYMVYLLERGTSGAVKEYVALDREINGPQSVQAIMKPSPELLREIEAQKAALEQNDQQQQQQQQQHQAPAAVAGAPVPPPNPAAPEAENPYQKYYQQQPQPGEQPQVPYQPNGSPWQ